MARVTKGGVEHEREHSLYEDIQIFGLLDTEKKAALTRDEFCAAVSLCKISLHILQNKMLVKLLGGINGFARPMIVRGQASLCSTVGGIHARTRT